MPTAPSWCACPSWRRWRRRSTSAATTGPTPPKAWPPRPPLAGGAGALHEPARRVSRLLAQPAAVAVETRDAGPVRLRVDRRNLRVERVLSGWRLETDWWRAPLSREYWKLWLSGDLVCEVYQDRLDGQWKLTRWYD